MCKIHRIHHSINTLKISINRITESIVVFKSIGNVTACVSFFVRYLIENDFFSKIYVDSFNIADIVLIKIPVIQSPNPP